MKHPCLLALMASLGIVSCTGPVPGPDKQGEGMLGGAALGAGTGAITGFQLGTATGPGAIVGAGFGAVAGSIRGAVHDTNEDQLLALSAQTRSERQRAHVREVLSEHYKRRLELHPTRDLFPADIFFSGDETQMRADAIPLVHELARMNKDRLPWSRLVVAAYVRSADEKSSFAQHLAERRSRELADRLIQAGLEPRRVIARAVVVSEPVLIDPDDRPERYNQAIELIPLDR